MPSWNHSVLGNALSKSYSFEYSDRLKTFAVAGGVRRLREFDILNPYLLNLQWNFKPSQFIAFETFFINELGQGELLFDMDLLTGVGFQSQECLFLDGYTYVKVGNDTRVTAKMIVKRDFNLIRLPDLGEFYDIIDARTSSNPAIDIIDSILSAVDIVDGGKSKDYL